MRRNAHATWIGDLKAGHGTFSVASGVITNQQLSYQRRFGDEPGTNPEELVAAAHPSYFSMALAGQLGARAFIPEATAR